MIIWTSGLMVFSRTEVTPLISNYLGHAAFRARSDDSFSRLADFLHGSGHKHHCIIDLRWLRYRFFFSRSSWRGLGEGQGWSWQGWSFLSLVFRSRKYRLMDYIFYFALSRLRFHTFDRISSVGITLSWLCRVLGLGSPTITSLLITRHRRGLTSTGIPTGKTICCRRIQ